MSQRTITTVDPGDRALAALAMDVRKLKARPASSGGAGLGEVRSDQVGAYSYMGTATTGTAESAPGWTIARILLSSPFTVTHAIGVKWDDRLTAVYT